MDGKCWCIYVNCIGRWTYIYILYENPFPPPASGLSASSFQTKTFVVLVSYQVCFDRVKIKCYVLLIGSLWFTSSFLFVPFYVFYPDFVGIINFYYGHTISSASPTQIPFTNTVQRDPTNI